MNETVEEMICTKWMDGRNDTKTNQLEIKLINRL